MHQKYGTSIIMFWLHIESAVDESFFSFCMWSSQKHNIISYWKWLTCSGLSPMGTQVYSSRAHPESSSDWDCFWLISSGGGGTDASSCFTPLGKVPGGARSGDIGGAAPGVWWCGEAVWWWGEGSNVDGNDFMLVKSWSDREHLQWRQIFLK